ncbi:hypothetical protein JCM8097_002573 [Rhodosporidiobolus ruineniae]
MSRSRAQSNHSQAATPAAAVSATLRVLPPTLSSSPTSTSSPAVAYAQELVVGRATASTTARMEPKSIAGLAVLWVLYVASTSSSSRRPRSRFLHRRVYAKRSLRITGVDMARYRLVAALAATAISLVSAQTGYGRFPCTIVNGDGSYSPDQTQCADGALMAPRADDPGADVQGDRASPTGAICQLEQESGAYFCGIAGAACTTDANCDNGVCSNGVCQGGFMQGCAGMDQYCNGFLYCVDASFEPTASNTCGGFGAFCQDHAAVDPSLSVDEAQPVFNQFCSTGYCNSQSGNCDYIAQIGEDCSSDPSFKCGSDAICDNGVCTPIAVPLPTPYTVYKTIQLTDGPPSGLVNLAPSASLTASSEVHDALLSALVDGKIGGKVNGVGSDMENWSTAWEKAGAWAALSWSQPITVHRIVLWDRPNLNDWVTGSRITLSDGRVISGLTPLDNDGRQGFGLDFLPPVTTSSIRIDITDVGQATYAIGLSEVQVYGPALVVVPSSPVNLALSAVCSASSEWAPSLASSACDGIVGGYVASLGGDKATLESQEWGTRGEGGGAWLLISWSSPVSFNQVVLWDRLNPDDNIVAGRVEFGNGLFVGFGALDPNGAAGMYLNLDSTVTTTSIKVYISANIGLAEVQVYLADLSALDPLSLLSPSYLPTTTTTTSTSTSTSTNTAAPAPTGSNIAPLSSASASAEGPKTPASYAVSGVDGPFPDTDHNKEWGTPGGTRSAWLTLTWPSPVSVDSIVLWDRPNSADQITGGSIEFDDGTSTPFGAVPNSAQEGLLIALSSTKTISSLKVVISSVSDSTYATGLAQLQVFGAVLPLPATTTTTTTTTSSTTTTTSSTAAVPLPTTPNLALRAIATASSEWPNSKAAAVRDSVIGGYVTDFVGDETKEWSSYTEGGGAWIRLDWTSPISLNRIVLWDRPNALDQVLSGNITFSDGSGVDFGAVPNDASTGLYVNLAASVTTTSLKVYVFEVSPTTQNAGFSEIQVYKADLSSANPASLVSPTFPAGLPVPTTSTSTTSSVSTTTTTTSLSMTTSVRPTTTTSSDSSAAPAPAPTPAGNNLATIACISANSEGPSTPAYYAISGATGPRDHLIVLWDRPNPQDQVMGGWVDFEDGSVALIGELDNTASVGFSVPLDSPKVGRAIKINLSSTSPSTYAIGLAQVQVFGTVLPLNGDSTTTTTITSSSSSSNANPQVTPAPTPNAGSQTPFRVQGAAATTKVLDAPVMAYCGGSRAYRECKAGADELVQCCTADAATCAVIHEANLQNCDTIGEASYLCASSEDGDMEECCEAMFEAYFEAGEEPARGNGCGAMRR